MESVKFKDWSRAEVIPTHSRTQLTHHCKFLVHISLI